MRHRLLTAALLCACAVQAQQPWTAQPKAEGNTLRFAVLADRTGGERTGVLARAIPAVNAQKPDFVISVGDVVDGYTTDTAYLDRQWQEFEAIRKQLLTPYIYVPGNHDMSNRFQFDDWNRRYGASYYHFRVGGTLFLVINTDDQGQAGMSEAQIRYFLDVLRSHMTDENLFVVMHRPLWKEPAGSGKMGYEPLEKALAAYPYTLFSGHEHYYLKREINGNAHYMLATLGGGSAMRGEALGEFDHFMLVEVEGRNVVVRNLLADGREISTEIVTEAQEPMVKTLRDEGWMEVLPTVALHGIPKELTARILLRNPAAQPMEVSGTLPRIPAMRFSPASVARTVAPGATDTLTVTLHATQGIDIDALPQLDFQLTATFRTPQGKVEAPARKRWYTDYPRTVGYTLLTINNSHPRYIKEDWDWHGIEDGGFTFTLFSDNNYLYIDIDATDDTPLVDPMSLCTPQDRFVITLDRAQIILYGDDRVISDLPGVLVRTEQSPQGYRMRVAVPNREFKGKTVRLNIGFTDQDNTTNAKPAQLYWQPEIPELGLIKIN